MRDIIHDVRLILILNLIINLQYLIPTAFALTLHSVLSTLYYLFSTHIRSLLKTLDEISRFCYIGYIKLALCQFEC